MQWTDRIRRVKIYLVLAAVLIAVGSLLVSHFLTQDLKVQEKHKMEVWGEAMRVLSMADEDTDLSLVLKVVNDNDDIPVIVFNSLGQVTEFRNIFLDARTYRDSLQQVTAMGANLLANKQYIRIALDSRGDDYITVCYDQSLMLKRLSVYPFVQLGVVLVFVVVAIFALLTSKRAEQNKVWVGLSKETAHQLGTPTSSLMAWVEILRESYPDDELIPEMSKDIKRLQLIADRFSKIGSYPELSPVSLNECVKHVVDYMGSRISKKVGLIVELPDDDVIANLNPSLFEWVLENLLKNSVDAMGAEGGSITIGIEELKSKAMIHVSDTGKGIRRKDLRNIFRPGFTTKKRGWGLGLSLARRIVEEYHQGRIYVKSSEPGRGTTFCIELHKYVGFRA